MITTSIVARLVPEYRAAMAEINALVERTLDPAVPDCDAPSTAEINDARLRLHVAALTLAQAVSDQMSDEYDADVASGRIREVTIAE